MDADCFSYTSLCLCAYTHFECIKVSFHGGWTCGITRISVRAFLALEKYISFLGMVVFLSKFLLQRLNQTLFLHFVCPQSDQIRWDCQQHRRCLTFQANLGWVPFHHYGPSWMTHAYPSDWHTHVSVHSPRSSMAIPALRWPSLSMRRTRQVKGS